MRFTLAALSSIATTLAATHNVLLTVDSSDSSINNKGLDALHEGAGINDLFIGDTPLALTYDDSTKFFQSFDVGVPSSLAVDDNLLQVTVTGATPFDITSDGHLAVNGNEQFFACTNINDPTGISDPNGPNHGFSSTNLAITVSDSVGKCQPVKIFVKDAGSASASASASPSASAPFSNTTTISGVTVTDYTTVCPEATTFTIATCTNNVCAPHVVTVQAAETVTVTGECVVPSSAVAKASTPTTVAAQSTSAPAVTTSALEGSGAKNVAGAAAVVIAAAAAFL